MSVSVRLMEGECHGSYFLSFNFDTEQRVVRRVPVILDDAYRN